MIHDECKDCDFLKKKVKHYCQEEYWDNHIGMNGIPASKFDINKCRLVKVVFLNRKE